MSQTLFLHIVDVVKQHDNYFNQRRNASCKLGLHDNYFNQRRDASSRKLGLSTLQKVMTSI